MQPAINRNQMEHEARAKILWGEEPNGVVIFLRTNGFSAEDASALVDELLDERRATVRGIGVKKIVVGSFLVVLPVAFWLVSWYVVGVVYLWPFAGTVCGGLWGAYQVVNGAIKLSSPDSHEGDLTDE